jgi:sulfur relay (sulfurtransferase) complex TusBCD TusD component (DsrE family)
MIPVGTERSYNGLRLANSLAKDEESNLSVFLMGDAASCAVAGQTTPNGYYNIERMLKVISSKSGKIGVSAGPAWTLAASSLRRLRRAPIEARWRS